jgi:hypothetical protein
LGVYCFLGKFGTKQNLDKTITKNNTIMKLTKKTIQLICNLERLIGEECYNPNSFDGWTLVEGREYRYPITYTDKDSNQRKSWSTLHDLDKKSVGTMHYKFGSNNLFIGIGLHNVLEYLEKNYGLDFDELVKMK